MSSKQTQQEKFVDSFESLSMSKHKGNDKTTADNDNIVEVMSDQSYQQILKYPAHLSTSDVVAVAKA